MVIYSVRWALDKALIKGLGRAKSGDFVECFSVICRNSKDAIACLEYHFRSSDYKRTRFSLDDGTITLQRMTVDSRNFTATYMMMDGIAEPLFLSDLKRNGLRAHLIFR